MYALRGFSQVLIVLMLRFTKPLITRSISTTSTWARDWESIKQMRSVNVAPVDTMGAEALADKSSPDFGSPSFRFRTLIATMLSPQTKDKQTSIALDNLIKRLSPKPFLPCTLIDLSERDIEVCISGVSFAKTKSTNILKAARTCVEEYNNDIPPTIEKLLLLRGVGPKIAYLTLSIALNQHLGIVVDTHVHRIANRLNWVQTRTPEHTRKQLESLIPQEHWKEVNNLLVGFGQTVCSARAPKCSTCLLKETCPFHLNSTKLAKQK